MPEPDDAVPEVPAGEMRRWTATLTVASLVYCIRDIPKADREDLSELLRLLPLADTDENLKGTARAAVEILEQRPLRVMPLEATLHRPEPRP
jgi:hypothetical protein